MTVTHAQIEAKLARHASRVRALRKLILAWFRREGRAFRWRDADASNYVRVVSEILLQRTRADTVAAFFPRFLKRFPGWGHLAAAGEEEMRAFLEPIGLWRRKASSLRALGQEMQRRKGRFPCTRTEIEALPGIGQYIANAILLLCHGQPQPLLDVNMARVLERIFGPRQMVDIRYDPYLQILARRVVGKGNPVKLNWAILDLAAMICTPRDPKCPQCPLVSTCKFARTRSRALET